MVFRALLLASSILASVFSSQLISEQVAAYRKLIGTDKLTAEGLLKILKLHDGDTVCAGPCVRHIDEFIGSRDGMDWKYLETLIEKIYGDAISSDPLDPQEVHISLTDSPNEMKVMWVTMDNLRNPFVEYTLATNTWTESNSMRSVATTDTYTVPMNWYPTFAGIIYEANMVQLTPGKVAYKYRVGGYDDSGNTHLSQDFTFHSVPNNAPNEETVFAMLGDQVIILFMLFVFLTSYYISIYFSIGNVYGIGVHSIGENDPIARTIRY